MIEMIDKWDLWGTSLPGVVLNVDVVYGFNKKKIYIDTTIQKRT